MKVALSMQLAKNNFFKLKPSLVFTRLGFCIIIYNVVINYDDWEVVGELTLF